MTDKKSLIGEMTLKAIIWKYLTDAYNALAEMPKITRWFHIFWLSGPFILLIERSPADAWITICALAFLVRSIIKKKTDWLRCFWVRAIFVFWIICLFSAAISDLPAYSLGEAFIWIRFPLFAMASCFWLSQDKRLLYGMMMSTMIGMVIMCCISLAEILIVGQQGGRLSWPYGDLVPGNYLAKVGLPAFCVLIAVAVSGRTNLAVPAGLLSLFNIVISVATGERMNFILRACAGMMAAVVWKPKLNRVLFLFALEFSAIFALFLIKPKIGDRFVNLFISQLPSNLDSPYLRAWNGGIDAFLISPVIGIGPDNYRILCTSISGGANDVDCHTHPHNYYIQIAAETGIIGLIAATVFICAIIWACFKIFLENRDNVIASTAFIIPLGLFFPIQSTADFFGQWNNIFMWSSIALALSAANSLMTKNNRC